MTAEMNPGHGGAVGSSEAKNEPPGCFKANNSVGSGDRLPHKAEPSSSPPAAAILAFLPPGCQEALPFPASLDPHLLTTVRAASQDTKQFSPSAAAVQPPQTLAFAPQLGPTSPGPLEVHLPGPNPEGRTLESCQTLLDMDVGGQPDKGTAWRPFVRLSHVCAACRLTFLPEPQPHWPQEDPLHPRTSLGG